MRRLMEKVFDQICTWNMTPLRFHFSDKGCKILWFSTAVSVSELFVVLDISRCLESLLGNVDYREARDKVCNCFIK